MSARDIQETYAVCMAIAIGGIGGLFGLMILVSSLIGSAVTL